MYPTERQLWSDDKLLEMLKAGDEFAFECIYNKYWSKLYISAYNLLRDRQACEDLIQEVLVSLWTRRETLSVDNLNAFLYMAVRYKVFKAIKAGLAREDLFDEISHIVIDDKTQDDLAKNDFNRLLDAKIALLPPKCRQIFILSRKQQLSTKEIAERLNLSPKTVENQITIALKKLKSSMGEFLFWYLVLLPHLWN